MSEEQIKDMILKQCLELTTNNDFRPPISAYDGIDIDDVVRTCKQLQDKKTYLDLVKENQELKKENEQLQKELEEYKNPIRYFKYANKNVVDENKKLKDNWNKLKEYLENKIDEYSINLEYLSAERMTQIKNKMQELEKGSD